MILAWRDDELPHGQAQNGVNFDFEVQGQPPPPPPPQKKKKKKKKKKQKTVTLTKVFYTYGPNLVILARTGDELSRGQACGYRTHRRTQTDRRRQRQYPKAKTGLG